MKRLLLSIVAVTAFGVCHAAELGPEVALVYPVAPSAGKIEIDGDLSDAGWKNSIVVSGFTDSGSPEIAKEQTSMQLCYDNDFFYIGITCFESEIGRLHTACQGHDATFWEDDSIEVFVDENHDHATFYQFAVTAGRATFDLRNGDSVWNGKWQSAVKRQADRWTVEIALPFTMFEHFEDKSHFEPVPGAVWGFNVCRTRRAGGKLELFNWADVQRNFHQAHLFGHLLYMPKDWEGRSDIIAKAAVGAGRLENQLQLQDGFWLIPANGAAPRRLTYSEAIVERFEKYPERVAELKELLNGVKLKESAEFETMLKQFDAWKAKSGAGRKVSSEEYAQATIFYSNFIKKLNEFYWLAKLAKLNQEI